MKGTGTDNPWLPAFRAMGRAIVSALVTYALLVPNVTLAITFHSYSVGRETTGSGFTGVRSNRYDMAVSDIPDTGCGAPFTGSAVYQTEWVASGDGLNWREIGTGHQCHDTYRYWYWAYGVDGGFYPIGEQLGISNGQAHIFKISRAFDGTANRYYFAVDNITKGTLYSERTFARVEAGLESLAGSADVIFSTGLLEYQKNNGAFSDWSGKDAKVVDNNMCGQWNFDTTWQSGEGSAC